MNNIEVKWKEGSILSNPLGIIKNVKDKANEMLPTFTNMFKKIFGKFSDALSK